MTTTDTKEEIIFKKSVGDRNHTWYGICSAESGSSNAGGDHEVASVWYNWKITDNIAFYPIPAV